MPLCKLLGGQRRDRVTAYASTLFRDTPQANAEAAHSYVRQGFHAVNFGWGVFGEDAGRDVEILSAIREALRSSRVTSRFDLKVGNTACVPQCPPQALNMGRNPSTALWGR